MAEQAQAAMVAMLQAGSLVTVASALDPTFLASPKVMRVVEVGVNGAPLLAVARPPMVVVWEEPQERVSTLPPILVAVAVAVAQMRWQLAATEAPAL